MTSVGLSQSGTNVPKQSPSQQKYNKPTTRESMRQKTLLKQVTLLTEGLKIRDNQIMSLKNIISTLKLDRKTLKTALTTESDCDPIDYSGIQLTHFPLSSTIESYRQQLELMKEKYSQSCSIISELQGKLRAALLSSKNKEQQFKNEIQALQEDLKYLKEEHSRNLDCMNIQMQHRQAERLKIVQNKYKQQMEILNEEIKSLRQDNSEKVLEITRLNQKIKKERANNDANTKFIENQNAELRAKVDRISIELKEEFRKRQEGMIAQFQVDLQLLHDEQAGQIKMLCDRIRILKSLLEEKDVQLKELWKVRTTQAENKFAPKSQTLQTKLKSSEELQFSTIDKYLKQGG